MTEVLAVDAVDVTNGTIAADDTGTIAPALSCSAGQVGGRGTLTAQASGKPIATNYVLAADDHQPIKLALPPNTTGTVNVKATPIIGTAPKSSATLTVNQR